jgi:antitoxin (DNA-binding transcriptional repressor) of toxin-antitoxin stability system
MKSYQARDARLKMRDILTAVEQGEAVEIRRYDTPTAIVVSPAWHQAAVATFRLIGLALEDKAAGLEWQSVLAALKAERDAAGPHPAADTLLAPWLGVCTGQFAADDPAAGDAKAEAGLPRQASEEKL